MKKQTLVYRPCNDMRVPPWVRDPQLIFEYPLRFAMSVFPDNSTYRMNRSLYHLHSQLL